MGSAFPEWLGAGGTISSMAIELGDGEVALDDVAGTMVGEPGGGGDGVAGGVE